MAGYRRLGMVALLWASVAAGAANAQALQQGEVLGAWTLRITPAESRGFSISVRRDDGGRPDLPLTVSARGPRGITCAVGGEAAECELRRGELVITSTQPGGRLTFTLSARRGAGFAGTTRMSARLLPFGSVHVGAVNMDRS